MPETIIHSLLPKIKKYIECSKNIQVPGWLPGAQFRVETLAQGEYHLNYLVQQDDLKWVLRISTGSQYGLSKQAQIAYEFQTLLFLEPLGIAPIPYFMDNSLSELPFGILGMQYLTGESLNYKTDLASAARVFSDYHQFQTDSKPDFLMPEVKPLSLAYERSLEKLQNYFHSSQANPKLVSYLKEVLDWAEQARSQEIYFLQDPWHTLINTEVNNSNWIINRNVGSIHLVDWEKPLWGDPSRDLSHFLVPTTTLWKANYKITEEERNQFIAIFKSDIKVPHLRDTIEEKIRLHDPFNCLRAIAWCAKAQIEYKQGKKLIKNQDTLKTISRYLEIDFVRSLFDPLLEK